MKKLIYPLFILFIYSSCNEKSTTKDTENIRFNKTNYNDSVSYLDSASFNMDSIKSDSSSNMIYQTNQNTYTKTNYVIVHLVVQQNNGRAYDEYGLLHLDRPQELNVVSGVQELENVDETTKAKLKDAVISNYLNSTDAKLYRGKILSAKVFQFDNYLDASEKRNSYLVEE